MFARDKPCCTPAGDGQSVHNRNGPDTRPEAERLLSAIHGNSSRSDFQPGHALALRIMNEEDRVQNGIRGRGPEGMHPYS